MELVNYRGVQRSSVEFSQGLTVVEGPNEVGKSSLPEAFRNLRQYKSSSAARPVEQTKPVDRDAGPEVTVTLTAGPYWMKYRKRWLVRHLTELEIRHSEREGSATEHFTGLAAHDRFQEILEETVDVDLLNALDVAQGESLDQATLVDIRAMSASLDGLDQGEQGDVPGQDVDDESSELLGAVKKEYSLYFTGTGRPTKLVLEADRRVGDLEDQVQALQAEVDSVEYLADQHRETEQRLGELREELRKLAEEARSAEDRLEAAELVRSAAERAREELGRASESLKEAQRAKAERQELAKEVKLRREDVAELEEARAVSDELLYLLGSPVAEAQAALRAAKSRESDFRDDIQVAQIRLDARREYDRLEEWTRLLGQVADLDSKVRLSRAEAEAQSLTETQVQELVDLDQQLNVARIAAGAAAPKVTVERLGVSPVRVGDNQLATDETSSLAALTAVTVSVPGVVNVLVEPGETKQGQASIDSAEQELSEALRAAGVASLAEAHQKLETKLDAERRLGQFSSSMKLLLDGRDIDRLKDQIEEARASIPSGLDAKGLPELRELEHALVDLRRGIGPVEEEVHENEQLVEEMVEQQAAAREKASLLAEKHRGAAAELERAEAKLGVQREHLADDALEDQETRAVAELYLREKSATELDLRLENEDLLELTEAAAYAQSVVRTCEKRIRETQTRYDELSGKTQQAAGAGTYSQLEEMQTELEAARSERAALRSRALSAQLLHDTLVRYKQEAQERYVSPFRSAIEDLGRPLFGADFTVTVSSDLKVVSRTLNGRTIPFGSLSAGAREQIALLGRLACARLVAADGGAPVILDDAFGFADPDRLDAMNRILTEVAKSAQVVLLTCQPERFPKLGDASFVSLRSSR